MLMQADAEPYDLQAPGCVNLLRVHFGRTACPRTGGEVDPSVVQDGLRGMASHRERSQLRPGAGRRVERLDLVVRKLLTAALTAQHDELAADHRHDGPRTRRRDVTVAGSVDQVLVVRLNTSTSGTVSSNVWPVAAELRRPPAA